MFVCPTNVSAIMHIRIARCQKAPETLSRRPGKAHVVAVPTSVLSPDSYAATPASPRIASDHVEAPRTLKITDSESVYTTGETVNTKTLTAK